VAFHYLAIEGPIGVGKTRLAERLASKLEATTILEDTENPFLGDFYAGRPGSALQAQLFYLLNRHRQMTGKRQADLFLQTTICDYVFDKDKIFAYLNLDDNELFIYQRLFDLLAQDVPTPDLVIYLQTPSDVLLERLHARERDQDRPQATPDQTFALAASRGTDVSVVVVDADAYGVGFVGDLRTVFPSVRVIAIATHPSTRARALRAGAVRALPRSTTTKQLAKVIATVASGR